jgi:TonB family protein
MRSIFLLPALLLSAVTALAAQTGPCRVVADTAVVPSPKQVAERRQLRASLDSIARRGGVAAPSAILYVDVDTTRHGTLVFIDSNLTPAATLAATHRVEQYLTSLEGGRAYQALIRLDADYVAPAPGKRACSPVLENRQELIDLLHAVAEHHPQAGRLPAPVTRNAVVRLVVNRRGTVSYVEVVQPAGDEFVDRYVASIAERLRFTPATLDDVPYDVRTRFTLTFNLN